MMPNARELSVARVAGNDRLLAVAKGGGRVRFRATALALLIVAGLLAAACGSDDDDDASTDSESAEATDTGAGADGCTVTWGIAGNKAGEELGVELGDADYRETYGGGDPTTEQSNLLYSLIIDRLNQNGGFGGCTVKPVYVYLDSLSPDIAAEKEAACSTLVEDEDVDVALILEFAFFTDFAECLADRGVPVVYADQSSTSEEWAGSHEAQIYLPYDIYVERWGPMIDLLDEAGYFGQSADRSDVKAGILTVDAAMDRTLAEEVWEPRLTDLGIDVETATYALSAELPSNMASAVLSFRDAGVTHVLFGGGPVSAQFMNAAESQGYRPRYAMTTRNTPAYQINLAPLDQFESSMVVGWLPGFDGVAEGEEPQNPAIDECREVYPAARQIATFQITFAWCDLVGFLAAVGDAAPSVDPEGIREGVAALGSTWQSTMLYGGESDFGDRTDGGSMIRILEFDSAEQRYKLMDQSAELP